MVSKLDCKALAECIESHDDAQSRFEFTCFIC
jgi:hypothetical protein